MGNLSPLTSSTMPPVAPKPLSPLKPTPTAANQVMEEEDELGECYRNNTGSVQLDVLCMCRPQQ